MSFGGTIKCTLAVPVKKNLTWQYLLFYYFKLQVRLT
jgi:hypothetical protein